MLVRKIGPTIGPPENFWLIYSCFDLIWWMIKWFFPPQIIWRFTSTPNGTPRRGILALFRSPCRLVDQPTQLTDEYKRHSRVISYMQVEFVLTFPFLLNSSFRIFQFWSSIMRTKNVNVKMKISHILKHNENRRQSECMKLKVPSWVQNIRWYARYFLELDSR